MKRQLNQTLKICHLSITTQDKIFVGKNSLTSQLRMIFPEFSVHYEPLNQPKIFKNLRIWKKQKYIYKERKK